MSKTKRELITAVADRLGMAQAHVAAIVEETMRQITDALGKGHRLELRDFGVFEVKTRGPRTGRNPRTGEAVPILEHRTVTFRPGKEMKKRVAESGPERPEA